MKISLNTIKTLTKVETDVKGLEDLIARKIGDVEHVEDLGKKYQGILVAEIKEAKAHPDSETLGVYQIDIGQPQNVQIVAGDKTLQVGEKIAYFPVGVKVPFNAHPEKFDGTVQEASLRGVTSYGMAAAAKELDISADFTKVMRLDTTAKNGTTLAEAYGLNDYVIEIENKALTNRPECFGLIGIARELAGIQLLPYTTPKWFNYNSSDWKQEFAGKVTLPNQDTIKLTVENAAGELCPRYIAVAMDNVTIKESPVWLQIELAKHGMRPINNVVDITNYLMILTGQPLHAFDLDKVTAQPGDNEVHILVRTAQNGERVTIIDGTTKELDDKTVVITDGTSPIAIAGVMGGLSSEINENTKRIVLECANFNMYNIRKTMNRLGIFSDAATRYSRNQDPEMCETVIYKMIEMMQDLAGAKLACAIKDDYQFPRQAKQIAVSLDALKNKTGLPMEIEAIQKTLANVELVSTFDAGTQVLTVNVPTYRQDLNIPEDIYEEVARLYSFDSIPLILPSRSVAATKRNPILDLQSKIRHSLAGMGGYELLTYNFTSKDLLMKAGQDLTKAFHLKNPLSPELEYLRMSLMPSLLEKVGVNIQQGQEEFVLFEINKGHIKGEMQADGLPQEIRYCSLVFSATDKLAKQKFQGSPYYQAKLYLDSLLGSLKATKIEYEPMLQNQADYLEILPGWLKMAIRPYLPQASALVTYKVEGKKYFLGVIGTIQSDLRAYLNVPAYTSGFEINVEQLEMLVGLGKKYVEPSRFPKVMRDFCFVADKDVPYEVIVENVYESLKDNDLICEVIPVDIYLPAKESGERQVTIRLALQSKSKQLTEKDVEYWTKKVVRGVLQGCGAKLKE